MSGPPKTPPRLHLIRGNPSKRPVKDSKKTAKKDEKGLPKIPQHLGAQGKYWFRRMAEELNAEGIISQLDARALELLVEAYIGAHTHSVAIGSHGHTITVNAAGNAENTVKNIAFNYIVRLA
ncbi:P27 family phage terminase small subunit [Escherichia sp. WS1112]|uniref:P27 family phage terminase small subunit n=1 Tax=Escherichia sp. WS1112 TaxID=3381923 RepID=UPI00396F29EF